MKKILFIILFVLISLFLFAVDKKIPERPSNIPEGVKWDPTQEWSPYYGLGFWVYEYKLVYPNILWYKDGNLFHLNYETRDKKYQIREGYYQNGNLRDIKREFNYRYLDEIFNKNKKGSYKIAYVGNYAGKQQLYYENGKLKEERSYTPVVQKDREVKSVLCGPELFYDETGKEVKRIEHNVKCEYNDIQRESKDSLIALIKSYKDKERNDSLVRLPVVGKIASVDSSSKVIEVAYKPGFELNLGDQVCCLIDNEIVSFECKKNDSGKGTFELKEDNSIKFASVNTNSEPRFYKKNEIKYADYLKSGSKPKAGDIKVIAGIEFVYIPEGEYFHYDSCNSDRGNKFYIKAFWMTKYEVTLGDFLKYPYEKNYRLPKNKTAFTFNSRYPALLGEYSNEARGFCGWFGDKHGVKTILPEVNEWEYAARGGTTTNLYWGSGKAGDYCWYSKNSGGKIHPVGQKKPNAYGLYDMIGNTWEWCNPFFLRGGSSQSDEVFFNYCKVFMVNNDYGFNEWIEALVNQGTGFRMIIREAE